jgi:chromatin segregation and condensation protein Rec8/ScpA/Scc1 (kleisin family)
VLEMVRLQAVALVQEKQFGEILLRRDRRFDTVFDESGGIRQIDEQYQ